LLLLRLLFTVFRDPGSTLVHLETVFHRTSRVCIY
jgi:hypothetical protein